MAKHYYRPLAQTGPVRPEGALPLAGGWAWFTQAERLSRDAAPKIVEAPDIPPDILQAITEPRASQAGLSMDRPRLMAILNATPDSFSDGGQFHGADAAIAQARALIGAGADLLDIGGESTRPGAETVPEDQESARVLPVIRAIRAESQVAISVDTRKAAVADAALAAGANLINDVSALTFDPALAPLVAGHAVPVCLMHAKGDPATMQNDPRYDNVVLDVYDALAARIASAEQAGIARQRIIVDPGIGFGKTLEHNLALLRNITLFHGLGVPILLGVSRKRFIGTIGDAPDPQARMPGSVALALFGVTQGVQITRIHDMAETKQALRLFEAVTFGTSDT